MLVSTVAWHRSRRVLGGTAVALAAVVSVGCGARLTSAQHAAGVGLVTRPNANVSTAPLQQALPTEGAVQQPGPVTVPAPGAGTSSAPTDSGPATSGTGTRTGPTQSVPTSGASHAPAATSAAAPPAGGCAAGALTASDLGVTPTTIRIGNSADVTGPIPGLFASAQDASKAFTAYFNSTGQTVCGRKLVLDTYDSGTSSTGDHDASVAACTKDFAMVGSLSAFDNGGVDATKQCGIPDLRAESTTGARQQAPTEFGAASQEERAYSSTTPEYFRQKLGDDAVQHAAYLYINAGASSEQAPLQKAAWEQAGWKFTYFTAVDITDFNYAPYVQQMKSKGIQVVYFLGAESQAGNFVKAIKSQGFHPLAVVLPSNMYGDVFPQFAGDAATNAYTFIPGVLFSESANNPEAQLYIKWLAQVAPNDKPSYFGEFAWSAMRLFVEQAQKVGPNLTRKGLIAQLKTVKDWTDHGMHAPQQVGAKTTGVCESVIQYNGSAWVRITPAPWTCGHLLSSGG